MLGNFFSMDGPFFKYGTLLFDMFVLNLVWAFTSGPLLFLILFVYAGQYLFSVSFGLILFYILGFIALIHIGPATTALFYVTNRKIRDDDGYLLKDYFKSYRVNYKQGLIVGAILTVVLFVLLINITAILGIRIPLLPLQVTGNIFGSLGKILLPVQLFIFLEIAFVSLFIFPLLARFHVGTKSLFKTAFMMANKHIFTTILCAIIFVAVLALGVVVHPLFFFISISGYALISSYLFERVFKQYMPSEDKDIQEEIEGEYSSEMLAIEEESLAEIFRKKREEGK